MRARSLLAHALVLSVLSGCASHQQMHIRPAIVSQHVVREAGLTPQQTQMVADLCFMGMPSKVSSQLGPTEYIFRQGYVLEHSSVDKIPLWVCEHVKKTQLGPGASRSDKFMEDPDLHGPKAKPADYTRSGYDQGHQAPAGNESSNQTLQNETFYMSNMAPQFPKMNRNAWKTLETQTRTWVNQFSEAYELTGPVFYDAKNDTAATATGTVAFATIGADGVAVPTHFYKIVAVKDAGQWKTIAFVMPNVANYQAPYHFEQYIRSIAWVEEHTGLAFMPDLTAQQKLDLKSHASAMWP